VSGILGHVRTAWGFQKAKRGPEVTTQDISYSDVPAPGQTVETAAHPTEITAALDTFYLTFSNYLSPLQNITRDNITAFHKPYIRSPSNWYMTAVLSHLTEFCLV